MHLEEANQAGGGGGGAISSSHPHNNNSSSIRNTMRTNGEPAVDVDAKHVGILALEVYTPSTFVRQAALEEHTGVPAGKYTLGLGQEGLSVTGDAEDVNSICLTAVQALLEK